MTTGLDPKDLPDTALLEKCSNEVRRESYREIERLAFWATVRGPRIYLIGGWAAWHYHQGLGSRDIDVVLPHPIILENFLAEYYRENGHEREGGSLTEPYGKPVKAGDPIVYFEIGAAHIDQGPPFREGHSPNLPFTLLAEHHLSWKVGNSEVLDQILSYSSYGR